MIVKVKFAESDQRLAVKFSDTDQKFMANFGTIQTVTEYVGGEPYGGDYQITPAVDAQTMPTKGKVMTDDVTVQAIPFFNVSNNSGGSTVYIAKEI